MYSYFIVSLMCSVFYHTGENFNFLTAVASVSAFATAFATIYTARIAKKSAKIAKNASFNTLFAQLMDNHISIFSNETLKVTKTKGKTIQIIKPVSVFTSFFEHCKGIIAPLVTIDSNCIKDTLYNGFLDTLVDSSDFSRCFKFVYHEIKSVQNTFMKKKDERKHYIGIIQASMNYDELFAYFINLLQHFANKIERINDKLSGIETEISKLINKNGDISKLLKEEEKTILKSLKKEDKKFLKLLKEDEFFKNLTEGHSTKYNDIIKKICNTPDPRINFLAGRIIKKEWLE